MLQARLKELERGRAAATTPKSADLEDTILGPLGRRLDAEEKGEGPSSTVELFRVEAPDAPGTVGPAAHEFTTFDAYAGQPPPPPPPPDDGIRAAFASPSPAADAKFYADDSDDDEALLAMHTAYQAAARRRPGARDQVWAGSDAVGNPADVLNAALVSGQPESPPAVPTPAGIAASTRPSPVADVGGRPRPAARRRPASEAWPVEARPPVRAPRSPPPSPPVRSRSRTLSDEAAGARAATINKVPPGAAVSPPRVPAPAPSPPPVTEAASTKTATPRGHRVVTMSRGSSARAPPPAEPAPPSPPPPPSSPLLDPRSPRPDRTPTFARARKLPVAAKRPAAAPAPAPPPPKVARRPPAAAAARPRRASKMVAVLVLLGYSLGVALRSRGPAVAESAPVGLTSAPQAEEPVRLTREAPAGPGRRQHPVAGAWEAAVRRVKPRQAVRRLKPRQMFRELRHRFRSARRPELEPGLL